MRAEFDIASITFGDEGMTIQYMQFPEDIRDGGRMSMAHQINFSANSEDHAELIDRLHYEVRRVLRDVLQDWEAATPVDPDDLEPDGDDEPEGMGMGGDA